MRFKRLELFVRDMRMIDPASKNKTKSFHINIKLAFAFFIFASSAFINSSVGKTTPEYPEISDKKSSKSKPKITPFDKVKKWHILDPKILRSIHVNKGKLAFSNKYIFSDDKSILWKKAKPGDYITFDTNLHRIYSLQFNLALLDDKGKVRKFKLEFLDSTNNPIFSYTFKTRRKWWNHTQFRAVLNKNNWISQTYNLWEKNCNLITRATRKCKLTVLNGTGDIYIGAIAVLPNYKTIHGRKSKNYRMDTGADGTVKETQIPAFKAKPASAKYNSDIKKIARRLDKICAVNTQINKAPGLSKKDYESICKRYAKHNLKRTRWAMTGENVTIIPNYTSWASRESDWACLFNDIAKGYWKSKSRAQRKELEKMFLMMFDYHWYLGGMPDAWHGSGHLYVESLFTMRKFLQRKKRLTQAVMDNLAMRLELGKMYHEVGRRYKGLDIDYLRMRLLDYPMFIVMLPEMKDRVHHMKQFKKWLDDIVFRYSPGVEDGFKPDGTTYHHWGFLDCYGKTAVNASAQAVWLLSKTKFAVKKRSHKLVRNLVFKREFYNPFMIHPPNLSGKFFNPKRYGGAGDYLGTQLGYLALAGMPGGKKSIDKEALSLYLYNLDQFKKRLNIPYRTNKYILQEATKLAKRFRIKPAKFPTGHLSMNWGAAAIHRINNWAAILKLHCRYQYEAESFDFSTFLGYGSLLFFNDTWKRYDSLKLKYDMGNPGWDWRLLPGTTTVTWPFDKVKKKDYKRYYADQTFCGGVEQNGNGISAIKIIGSKKQGLGSFRAQKCYFFLGDKIICLGNSISNNISDANTVTTLFQSNIDKNSVVNISDKKYSANLPEKKLKSYSSTYIIDPHGHGYYIFPDQNYRLKMGNQSAPDPTGKKTVKGDFAYAYIDHGKASKTGPLKNKSYQYIIFPYSNAKTVAQFSQKMASKKAPIKILSNSKKLSAVYSKTDKLYGLVCWLPLEEKSLTQIPVIKSVNSPCTILMKMKTKSKINLSIAFPDLNLKPLKGKISWGYSIPKLITIKLNGKFKLHKPTKRQSSKIVGNQTIITIKCSSGIKHDLKLTKR